MFSLHLNFLGFEYFVDNSKTRLISALSPLIWTSEYISFLIFFKLVTDKRGIGINHAIPNFPGIFYIF